MSHLLDLGRITGAHGVKGWVKIHSHTEPTDNIFSYQPWQLKTPQGIKPVELTHWQSQGKRYIAHIRGIDSRDQAEALGVLTISVAKSLLPELAHNEFYWHQLQGCRVISHFAGECFDFGTVKHLMPTGANDVLVVAADKQSMDQRERLLPYVPEQFIKTVDLATGTIVVHWDPEF